MRAYLLLFLLLLSGFVHAQPALDAIRDALRLQKDAVFLMQPDAVSGPAVEETEWSSDGAYLAIRRVKWDITTREFRDYALSPEPVSNPPARQILIYSAITGKSKVVAEYAHAVELNWMTWIPETSTLVVCTEDVANSQRPEVALISAVSGATKHVSSESTDVFSWPGSFPGSPYVWFSKRVQEPSAHTEIRFMDAKGLRNTVAIVPVGNGRLVRAGEGAILYYEGFEHGKRLPGGWTVDPESGRVEKVDAIPKVKFPNTTSAEIAITESRRPLSDAKPADSVVGVYLLNSTRDASIVISADAEKAELAPYSTAVSYESRGTLLVRRIVHVPLDFYKNQLRLALRKKALNAAKQLGLAILIYANDNDDKYPSKTSNWKDQIGPYLKDDSLAGSFNYTFAGGSAKDIESPATTELGYVDGPDGRAVVYADGHAKYITPP